MRIAALDLGSNSFHLAVVEARLDGSFIPLIAEKEMLLLGERVARTGRIGEPAATEAVAVIARFKAIAEAQRTDELVALGTAALREATDGVAFVDRVRVETGVRIEVVDGLREAQLIFRAIRASVLLDPSPALAADLGGGSLELSVGDQSELYFASSLRLGVGRLTAELVKADPPDQSDLDRLDERIGSLLQPALEEIALWRPRSLVGSSGTLVCLARMAAAGRDGSLPDAINQLTVSAADLELVAQKVLELPVAERAKLPGCDAKRASLLPAGVAVLFHLLSGTGLESLMVSEWALREGIVLSVIGSHDPVDLGDDPRAIRRASVLSLCRRSNWRQQHARKVAEIAGLLFDETSSLHRLGSDDRGLLEDAALLHDIGEHVSRSGHDRHGAYLVEHGGLRGYTPDEIRLLMTLVRFHVRGVPKPGFEAFGALKADDRRRALTLVALLRLADGLDATHAGIVERVAVEVGREGGCTLTIAARGDAELELWMARRKQELFERVFETSCSWRLEGHGLAAYESPDSAGTGFG